LTTGTSDEKLKQKALNYAIGDIVHKFVDVIEESDYYLVKVEDPYYHGRYHRVGIKKSVTITHKIEMAYKQLTWIAQGNEFPTAPIGYEKEKLLS
jgi:ribosome biogenesis protein Nip4